MPLVDPRSAASWPGGAAADPPRFPRVPIPWLQVGPRVVRDLHAFDLLAGAIEEECSA